MGTADVATYTTAEDATEAAWASGQMRAHTRNHAEAGWQVSCGGGASSEAVGGIIARHVRLGLSTYLIRIIKQLYIRGNDKENACIN